MDRECSKHFTNRDSLSPRNNYCPHFIIIIFRKVDQLDPNHAASLLRSWKGSPAHLIQCPWGVHLFFMKHLSCAVSCTWQWGSKSNPPQPLLSGGSQSMRHLRFWKVLCPIRTSAPRHHPSLHLHQPHSATRIKRSRDVMVNFRC